MTASLNNVAVQQFHDNFINKFASQQMLMDTCITVHGVVGDAYKWPVMGFTDMQLRGAAQSLIPASDVSHDQIITTFDDYVLNLPTDIFQQSNVNVNERLNLAQVHAKAAGRRMDAFKISAMDTAVLPADNVIPDVGTNLTVAKLRAANRQLKRNDVPTEQRWIVITASQQDALLAETEVTSSDFNTQRTLVNGEIDSFLSFKFITVSDRVVGGLPKAGNIRSVFAWNFQAIGLVFSLDPTTNVEWSVERQTWLSVSRLKGGSSVLLPEGVIEILCEE